MQQFLRTALRELWIPGTVLLIFFGLGYGLWLGPTHIVIHDTLHLYEIFQYTYAQLRQTGALPQWLPYINYGMPGYLNDIEFPAPFHIPAMWLAIKAQVQDTWRLYRLLLFADIAVFTTGYYLLAREYVTRLPAGIATAAITWTIVVQMNSSFTVQLFEFTPLVILFLRRWARNSDPVALLFAILAAALGSWRQMYFMVAFSYLYVVVAIVFVLFYQPKIGWPRGLKFWSLAALTVLLLGIMAYLSYTAVEGMAFDPPGRDPSTLRNDLHTFLTYGNGGFAKTLELLTAVPWRNTDALFYLGSLGLIFLLYGAWRVRSDDSGALLVLFAATLVFCWGLASPLAALSFYLPGMSVVRHTGLMYAVPRLFGALLAALGIAHFLQRLDDKPASGEAARADIVQLCDWSITAAVIALLFFFFIYKWNFGMSGTDRPHIQAATIGLALSVLAGLALMRLLTIHAKTRWLVPAFVMVLLAQAGAYQAFYGYDLFQRVWSMPREIKDPTPRPFEETRVADPTTRTNPDWYRGMYNQPAAYLEMAPVLNFDACVPITTTYYSTAGVAELIHRTLGADKSLANIAAYFKAHPDDPLFKTLGCGVSKLQWVDAQVAQPIAPDQPWPQGCGREQMCLESPHGGQRLTLNLPGGGPPDAKTAAENGIVVMHFTFNKLVLTVTRPDGGWLIYADAHHPFWRAEIDGEAAPIWISNFAFKALKLDPGRHEIVFSFGDWLRDRLYWLFAFVGTAVMLFQFWLVLWTRGDGSAPTKDMADCHRPS
jgi:hypothetical protein